MLHITFAFSQIVLIIILASCSQPPNAQSSVNKDGYALSLMVGTANLDSSFFYARHITGADQANSLAPQSSKYIALNFFVALTKDGKPLSEDVKLTFTGPEGSYKRDGETITNTYQAGNYWSDYLLFKNQGEGTYSVKVEVDNTTLRASAPLKNTDVLTGDAEAFQAGIAPKVLGLRWASTPGAASYITFVENPINNEIVYGAVSKETSIIEELDLLDIDLRYDATLISAAHDLSIPRTEPYPNGRPVSINTAIVSTSVDEPSNGDITFIAEPVLTLATDSNGSVDAKIAFWSSAGVVGYRMSIDGAPSNLTWDAAPEGMFFQYEELAINFSFTCNSDSQYDRATFTFETTNKEQPVFTMPIALECSNTKPKITETWSLATMGVLNSSYSDDSSLLAFYRPSALIIYDADTGEELNRFDEPEYNGNGHSAWGKGNQIALSDGNEIKIADALTGEMSHVLSVSDQVLLGEPIKFSPDGEFLLIANESAVDVFSTTTWQTVYSIPQYASDIVFSPSGERFALVDEQSVRMHDLITGDQIWINTFEIPGSWTLEFIESVAWRPDGKEIAATITYQDTNAFGSLFVWNADTGALLAHREDIYASGERLSYIDDKTIVDLLFGEAHFMSAHSGRTLSTVTLADPREFINYAVSSDGRKVAMSRDSNLLTWVIEP